MMLTRDDLLEFHEQLAAATPEDIFNELGDLPESEEYDEYFSDLCVHVFPTVGCPQCCPCAECR
jgi:hypothetical protein